MKNKKVKQILMFSIKIILSYILKIKGNTCNDPFVKVINLEWNPLGIIFHSIVGVGSPSAAQLKTTVPPISTTENRIK